MKELWNKICDFLVANDFPTLLKAIRKLEWSQIAKSPYTWLIIVPLLIYLIWTKKYKILTALASFFLFLLLIQKTLAPAEESLPLHDLLIFLAGAIVLVGLNIYLLFVRQ